MLNIIRFEMKKIVKSMYFRLLMSGLCLFVFLFYAFIYINTTRTDELVRNQETQVESQQRTIDDKKELVESGEADSEDKQELEFWEDFIVDEEKELQALKDEDWKSLLDLQIEARETTVEAMQLDKNYKAYTWESSFSMKSNFERNKWIRDKDVVPIFPIMTGFTLYDIEFDETVNGENIKEAHEKYSSSGMYYLYQLFGVLFGIIGAGFLLFLFGDIVTKEGLGRSGSIHFLYVQPIQRDKVLAGKFVSVILTFILILLGTSAVSLLTGTIFDRFGDWNYPILIYGEDYSFTLMNLSTYLFKSTVLFVMILLFCYSLLFLFSVITKRASIAIGITLGILLIGIKWSNEMITSALAPYIPFSYFSVPEVMSGERSVSLDVMIDHMDFTFTNGVASLGVFSAVILIVTFAVSTLQRRYSS